MTESEIMMQIYCRVLVLTSEAGVIVTSVIAVLTLTVTLGAESVCGGGGGGGAACARCGSVAAALQEGDSHMAKIKRNPSSPRQHVIRLPSGRHTL